MIRTLRFLALLAAGMTLAVSNAAAEPFSVQGFTGGTSTTDALPGVRLDASGAMVPDVNCQEYQAPSFGARSMSGGGVVRECTVGRFTFSTTQQNPFGPTIHNQYGKPPTVGWDVWRP